MRGGREGRVLGEEWPYFIYIYILQTSLMLNCNVVGRVVLFYFVVIYLMFAFIENGWLPIFASAFHLLQNALG